MQKSREPQYDKLYDLLTQVNRIITYEYLSSLKPNIENVIGQKKSNIDDILKDLGSDEHPSVKGLRQYSDMLGLLSEIPSEKLLAEMNFTTKLKNFAFKYDDLLSGRIRTDSDIMELAKKSLSDEITNLEKRLKHGEESNYYLRKMIELGKKYIGFTEIDYTGLQMVQPTTLLQSRI